MYIFLALILALASLYIGVKEAILGNWIGLILMSFFLILSIEILIIIY